MRRWISTAIALAAVLVMSLPATATADLGEVLGDIRWGDDRTTVLDKLRSAKLDELREDHRLRTNPSAMQDARQRTLDQMRRVEDSYTSLRGESTGYEVSVISGEFTTNNNESLLRVRDDVAQRFYMFLEGELYKLVVAYDQGYIENVGFEAFVRQVSHEYGDPVSSEHGDDGLERALWRDATHELRVEDRSQYFGTFTMTFSDRQRSEQLRADGREFGGSDRGDPEDRGISERVSRVTEPSMDRSNENIVDGMIGGDVDVSFPEDEEEDEEADEEEATASADRPGRQTSSSSDDDEDDEPAPRTTGGGDDDDDDDLVIY